MWHKYIKNMWSECPEIKDPFKDKVKCEECKHWIDKSDAYEVKHRVVWGINYTELYCPIHKKPYTEVNSFGDILHYFGRIEMDEDGVPVGYIRKPDGKK